jgi:hypothetical protein
MKKFICTAKTFVGEVHILYASNNQLLLIDFQQATLAPRQIEYLKVKCPAVYDDTFVAAFGNAPLEFVAEGYKVSFEMFWERYAHKVNKKRCMQLWDKLSEANKVKAFAGLNPYLRHLQYNTWKNKADPETYLRNQYWLNEYK